MHFMEWRPRARATARSRWYAAVDAAIAASAAEVAQQQAASRAAVRAPSAQLPAHEAAGQKPVTLETAPAAVAAAQAQPAGGRPFEERMVKEPAAASFAAAAGDGKPAAQGQGRLVSLVARAAGSWRGPRPSLSNPRFAGPADRPAPQTAVTPPQLELQRSSSSPLSSQLRARFEGLAAVVAPEAEADGEAAARRKELGGFSRRRLQVLSRPEAPRGVAVH